MNQPIWLSYATDSVFYKSTPIDSIRFKFVDNTLGKDSIQDAIIIEKDQLYANRSYFFKFSNLISRNTKIIIMYNSSIQVISNIDIQEYKREYLVGSSESCGIMGYYVNGIKGKNIPFTVNVIKEK